MIVVRDQLGANIPVTKFAVPVKRKPKTYARLITFHDNGAASGNASHFDFGAIVIGDSHRLPCR